MKFCTIIRITSLLGFGLVTNNSFTTTNFGGMDGGGGSTIAAEITRATEAFIQTVQENPQYFPEINLERLRSSLTEFIVVDQKIKICNSPGELDAATRKKDTLVNRQIWANKTWAEKVHLAGHERLVLTGYEKSNRYNISNRLYQIDLQKRIEQFGHPQPPCQYGRFACRQAKMIAQSLNAFIAYFKEGTITKLELIQLIRDWKVIKQMTIETLISIRPIDLKENLWDHSESRNNINTEKYIKEVILAFDAYLNPLFENAMMAVIQSSPPEIPCILLE